MCDQCHSTRIRFHRLPSSVQLGLIVLFVLFTSACSNPGATNPAFTTTPAPVAGNERITNGSFEQGSDGWIVSAAEAEGVEVVQPVVSAETARDGANGVRFSTQSGITAISAFEQEFAPAESFTFSFSVRPQAGGSRIGLAGDSRRSNVNVSRLVFLNAGDEGSQIVYTAWDVNYVISYPLEVNTWIPIRITVDGTRGVQTLQIGDNYKVTVSASQPQRPAALAIVLGDRQPRNDAYTIPNTNARVTDGLNGTYDYDSISLIGP